MFKKYRIYIILIIITSIIILFISKDRSTIIQHNIFAVSDTSSITKIFIADRQGNTILLDKKENNWLVNNKFNVRKDAIKILLNTLHQIRIKQPIPLNSFERVIRDLSTKGIKIEIYTNSKLLRTYTIGNETSDHLGTYMLLDGAEQPYIMHIPYFKGYLSPRYGIQSGNINERDWRDRTIINVPKNNIKNISIKNFYNLESSFSLRLSPRTLLFDYLGNPVNFNNQSISQFISNFRNVSCESFKSNKSKIESKNPIHQLIINNDTLRTYLISDLKEKKKQENFNVERMYATINDGELLLIQNYVFNKLLINIDELRK